LFGEDGIEEKDVGTVISEGTTIEGTVEVTESIRVDGKIEGKIIAAGDVFIGEQGELKADIKAENVMIAGLLKGNVEAKGKLEIVSTGTLKGDICISNLIIHDGGVFEGNSTASFEDGKLIDEKLPDEDKKSRRKKEVKEQANKKDED